MFDTTKDQLWVMCHLKVLLTVWKLLHGLDLDYMIDLLTVSVKRSLHFDDPLTLIAPCLKPDTDAVFSSHASFK